MVNKIKVQPNLLRSFCEKIFIKTGLNSEDAFIVADSLIFANLRSIE